MSSATEPEDKSLTRDACQPPLSHLRDSGSAPDTAGWTDIHATLLLASAILMVMLIMSRPMPSPETLILAIGELLELP